MADVGADGDEEGRARCSAYGDLCVDDRACAARGPRFEMDGVRTGGNDLAGDVDVVGCFTANECGAVVDGVAEG